MSDLVILRCLLPLAGVSLLGNERSMVLDRPLEDLGDLNTLDVADGVPLVLAQLSLCVHLRGQVVLLAFSCDS